MKNNQNSLRHISLLPISYVRFRYFVAKIHTLSLTRALQYEVLENYPLVGDVLDFGGGGKSRYRNLLQCSTYNSVNIDPNIDPTWLIKTDERVPCDNSSFDTVISLNTLEHIFDAQSILADLYRVLRPGGGTGIVDSFPVSGTRTSRRFFPAYVQLVSTGAGGLRFSRDRYHPFILGTILHCFSMFGPAWSS